MTISNGTCLAQRLNLGDSITGQGTLHVAGGTVTILEGLDVGLGGTQTLWQTGGQLTVTNGLTNIGFIDFGRMIVSNGTWRARDVALGNLPGSRGTLAIAGGTNTVSSSLLIGTLNCTATGIVTVSGGSLFVTNAAGNAVLDVQSGTLTISGGTLRADRIVITNTCAHLVRTGGTLIYGSAVLNPASDTDGDGFSNQAEKDAGSDPLDPTSTPVTVRIFPPGDVNGTNGVTSADSLLINQVLVGLRSSNDAIFATAGFANGDVNQTNGVTAADSLLINQVLVGLRSFIVTKIAPNVRSNKVPTAVTIFGVGFPTNTVTGASIGPPVNLTLSNVVVISREQINALVPAGGGLGTGTVNVAATPTNGVISFGRFINQ
jgi:hypothetical protein